MAISLIDKIKPKNGGTFPLVDAEDVLMPDGKRLSQFEPAGGGNITVDSEFSETSENPIMNKTVTTAFNQASQTLEGMQQRLLPTVTSANNGNFAQVVNGAWTAVDATSQVATVVDYRIASLFVPVTQAEYDALVAAGTMDETKYYMIVG